MANKKHVLWASVLGVLALLLMGGIIAQSIITNKITTFLESGTPPHIETNYEEISFNILNGNIALNSPSVRFKNPQTDTLYLLINFEALNANIGYWDYLFHKKISLGRLELQNPEIRYYPERRPSITDSTSDPGKKKPVSIKDLTVSRGKAFIINESKTDSVQLYAGLINLELSRLRLGDSLNKGPLPFTYESLSFSADSLYGRSGDYEIFTASRLQLAKGSGSVRKLTLKTKYSKVEHARRLSQERDHYNLSIDSIGFNEIDLGTTKDTTLLSLRELSLQDLKLEIFRNKLLPDETHYKPLFNEMLRKMPVHLNIDTIAVQHAEISYSEKTKEGEPPGTIRFDDLSTTITDLNNFNPKNPPTRIMVNARFMDKAPLNVDWQFEVLNPDNRFTFKADIGHLEAERLNKFTESTSFIRLTGEADQTYFTINGGSTQANIDLRIKYENFKLIVVKKDGKEKRWLLSALANLFVSEKSEEHDNEFVLGSASVSRNTNKSFFNYLWLNIQAGLRQALTGGNKD